MNTTKQNDRVRANTAAHVNAALAGKAARRVARAAGTSKTALTFRIEELDREWDMERVLQTNAAALALGGTILGLVANRKFFVIPCFVLPFLLQHALQGWCPPVPIFRRKGVRTRREIDAEKYALKALRGDFRNLPANGDPLAAGRAAWEASNA